MRTKYALAASFIAIAFITAFTVISRMDEVYKAEQSTRRFVTPDVTTFTLTKNAANDLQMVGGEFKVTFNPATGQTTLEAITYNWHDNVYVVGSVINQAGEQHRWKNDEMVPLPHKGNGVYEGVVTFYRDDLENMYPNFTIFSCRSNTGSIPYSTATRAGWNEGRYGSEQNKLILGNNVPQSDLIRGADRKWYMQWDEQNPAETQKYFIHFDMSTNTVLTRNLKGDINGDTKIDIADAVSILNVMAESAYVPEADINHDDKVDIADFVSVLNIMAGN